MKFTADGSGFAGARRRAVRARTLACIVALLGAAAAAAQPACAVQHRLRFPDGSTGCLTRYELLANQPQPGQVGEIQSQLRLGEIYAIAATVGPPSCAVVAGLAKTPGNPSQNLPGLRSAREHALRTCESQAARSSGADCACKNVVADGDVTIPRAQFEARFSRAAAAPPAAVAQLAPQAAVQSAPQVAPQPGPQGAPQPTPEAAMQSVPQPAPQAAPVAAPQSAAVQPAPEPQRPAAQPVANAQPRLRVRALVIGNGNYVKFGRLANPRNDARAMAQKFREMGYDVDELLDADRDAFVHALNEYSQRALGGDVNVLFYAGHGVQVEGVNYLLPTNMSADGVTPGYLKLNGISLNAVLDYMPAKTRIVFLDACRDNPVSRQLVRSRSGAAAGLAPVDAATGTLIAYATKDGATADDGIGTHSPYTSALLEHIDKPQDIAVVLRQVRQTVMRLTSDRQQPWEYGSLTGDQLVLSRIAKP